MKQMSEKGWETKRDGNIPPKLIEDTSAQATKTELLWMGQSQVELKAYRGILAKIEWLLISF